MTFLDTCKQKPHETIAEFEARCKYHGRRCEYSSMNNPEEELIRDRFVTGVRDDKLRAEPLRHKKEDGTTVTLAEVVNKAKAWEAAMMTNAKVIEAKQTEEQVHFSSSPGRSGSGSREGVLVTMEMEPGVMATISVSTRRSSSVARDRVDFAVRMSDTVKGTACEQAGCGVQQLWRTESLYHGVQKSKGLLQAPVPLLSQPMHWTMLPQQRRIAVMTLNTFVWMNQFMRCHHRHPSCLQRFLCLYLVILSWMLSFKWIQLLLATLCRIISSRKSARTQICNPPRPS